MRPIRATVVWYCVFSILSMGCYGSGLIEPTEDEREILHAKDIDKVVLKDGTKFVFREKDSHSLSGRPATIIGDSIIGVIDGKRIALPLSEVAVVHVPKFRLFQTVLFGIAGVGLAIFLISEFKKNIRFDSD